MKKGPFKVKSVINFLPKVMIAFLMFFSVFSEVQTVNAKNNIEPIQIITDTQNIEEGQSQIIIRQYSSTPDVENIEGARTLAGAKYTIYSDEALTQIVKTLETGKEGYTELLTVDSGSYYIKQTDISKRYNLDETVYHVQVASQQKAIISSKTDPQLTTIDPSELPPMPMPFAGSHTVSTSYEYGNWQLAGEGAYGQQSVLKIDGVIGFCLEGWKSEQSGSNGEVSWSTLGMDSYKEKLVLMGYYGYWRNPSAVNYYLTQSLIWDEVMRVQKNMGWQVYATSSYYGYTSLSSMQGFFSDVRSKVDNFYTKPSIHNYWYNCSPGQVIQPEDTKGVLSDCYISDKGGTDAKISGNSIVVTAPSTPGEYTIKIKRGTGYLYNDNLFAVRANSSAQAISTLDGNVSWDSSITIRVVESKGKVQLTKTSTNSDFTENNDCYSLAGAEYGVYKDSATTQLVGKITTDEDGKSNTLEVDAGTYYVKEITAPKGYEKDSKVYTVKVVAGSVTTVNVSDVPLTDPVSVLLHKVDADTGENVPVTNGSLADAEYTFKFYIGEYADDVDPATLGDSPTRSWVMKTNTNGYIQFIDSYKVSGDNFWYDLDLGIPTLPLGTLTIQETKAPIGYHLNNEIFVRKITPSGDGETVDTYNIPISKENSIQFHITKYETGTTTSIKDVEFIHTTPDGNTETLKTDAQGKISIVGLATGVHTIKESKTADGLIMNPNTFSFTINADGSISNFASDIQNSLFDYSIDDDGNGDLIIYNSPAPFDLKLIKLNENDTRLSGAVFELYSDSACTDLIQTVTTNDNGIASFADLSLNTTYYLRETKAPAGYRLPLDLIGNPVTHTVIVTQYSPTQNIFNFTVDGVNYTTSSTTGDVRLEGTQDHWTITMDILNTTQVQMPGTGSQIGMIIMIGAGIALIAYAVKNKKKSADSEDGNDK